MTAINAIDLTATSNKHGAFDRVRTYNLVKLSITLAVNPLGPPLIYPLESTIYSVCYNHQKMHIDM
jgi:hypothetical protein